MDSKSERRPNEEWDHDQSSLRQDWREELFTNFDEILKKFHNRFFFHARKSQFDGVQIQSKTAGKVPRYKPTEPKDTGSENGYLNIFFNICGILLAIATLPLGKFTFFHEPKVFNGSLGLYQEINVQTHAEANSIKQELYNIQAPSIKVGNDGWVTRCYFWTLGKQK